MGVDFIIVCYLLVFTYIPFMKITKKKKKLKGNKNYIIINIIPANLILLVRVLLNSSYLMGNFAYKITL